MERNLSHDKGIISIHFHVCSRRAFWYIVYIVKAAHTKQKYEGAHTDTPHRPGAHTDAHHRPGAHTDTHHRPGVSHCLTLSHNVVSSTTDLSGIRTHNVSCDRYCLHR